LGRNLRATTRQAARSSPTDEVDAVAEVVEKEFEIDLENSVDKRELLDPNRFGYLSMHYVASLSKERAQLTELERFGESCRFSRLAGVLELADDEFQALRNDQRVAAALKRDLVKRDLEEDFATSDGSAAPQLSATGIGSREDQEKVAQELVEVRMAIDQESLSI
jgi:hypothetical protein